MARSEAPQRGDSRLGRQSPPPFLPVCTRTAGAAVGVFAWIAFLSLLLVLVCFLCWPCVWSCQGRLLGGVFFPDVPSYFSLGLGFGICVLLGGRQGRSMGPCRCWGGQCHRACACEHSNLPPEAVGGCADPKQRAGWPEPRLRPPGLRGHTSGLPRDHWLGLCRRPEFPLPPHLLWYGQVGRPASREGSTDGYEAPGSASAFWFLSECKTS